MVRAGTLQTIKIGTDYWQVGLFMYENRRPDIARSTVLEYRGDASCHWERRPCLIIRNCYFFCLIRHSSCWNRPDSKNRSLGPQVTWAESLQHTGVGFCLEANLKEFYLPQAVFPCIFARSIASDFLQSLHYRYKLFPLFVLNPTFAVRCLNQHSW